MTSPLNWRDFLKQARLPEEADCLQNPHQMHSLVHVSGSDAESFLHAQFSNSVQGLKDGEVRFTAWCNAKGRVWTLLRYWKDADAYILRLPTDQLEDTLKRLRMFVLRSDVQLTPLEWHCLQFIGPEAKARGEAFAEQRGEQGYRIDLPVAWPGCEFWQHERTDSELPELPIELSALPRILARQPEIFIPQREAWIPQMLNLDKLGGIDLKKGCYPGQEIVAKLHYKGGLKQRMYLGHGAPGICSCSDISNTQGKPVGQTLEATSLGDKSWFTAVLRLEALEDGLRIGDTSIHILPEPAAG